MDEVLGRGKVQARFEKALGGTPVAPGDVGQDMRWHRGGPLWVMRSLAGSVLSGPQNAPAYSLGCPANA
jgi:hypothetical protein